MPTLNRLVTDDPPEGMGLCCLYCYLALEDIKMKAKPEGRLMPKTLVLKHGFTSHHASEVVKKYRDGVTKCQGLKTCKMVKMGLMDEPPPTLSEEYIKFLKLRGQMMDVWKVYTAPEPKGPVAIKGRIIGLSRIPWLWVAVALDYSPIDVKLGDQLQVTPEIWGTVTMIEDRTFFLLLPGKHHGQRIRDMDRMGGGRAPSFMRRNGNKPQDDD